jgi:hypothetical protein
MKYCYGEFESDGFVKMRQSSTGCPGALKYLENLAPCCNLVAVTPRRWPPRSSSSLRDLQRGGRRDRTIAAKLVDGTGVACRHGSRGVMSQLDKLVAERDALRREWQTNQRNRIKIQHRLDELTHMLCKATGLPLFAGDIVRPLDPFGFGRSRRRKVSSR